MPTLGDGGLPNAFTTVSAQTAGETAYVCPMHPDQISPKGGTCPRCGMALVLASPYDTRDYRLIVETVPPVVTAGEPFTIRLNVFHPGTGVPVKDFEIVHEKGFHLFVVSRDMDVFKHIHPEKADDGTWTVSTTVPKPGVYLIVSDFLPSRGSSQFLARPIVTAGYPLDLDVPSPIVPDDNGTSRTVDGVTARISYQPTQFWAEITSDITFTLTDKESGRAITDLEPYLGSFGHMFVMSEDTLDYVHAHPAIQNDADVASPQSGPALTFDVFMPRPGRYKAWAQFRRHDTIYTVPFAFTVSDPLSAPR